MRPNYRQNAQWTFRKRSQSRNRNENYNNDYTRARSRERHDNRPIQCKEEKNLGPDLTPGSILITIEYGVIDVKNMITSCPNALIPQLMKNQTMMMQIQHLYK